VFGTDSICDHVLSLGPLYKLNQILNNYIMGKIGRISTVKEIIVILAFKQCKVSQYDKNSWYRVFRYPYKELDGSTELD
jgi:protoporphyrinogen oxidase